jgi:cardiolipin synthase C
MWLLISLLSACASLPPVPDKRPITQNTVAMDSALGKLTTGATVEHAALNGIRVLDSGRDALLERAALIEAAEQSIDAQYYIWNADNSGRYLASRIYAAAERGVRVRLLLDDINVGARDTNLAALARHPNIEIRIYNPFATRGIGKAVNFLGEFARLNRRMHNKSFTVDGVVTILGGRNIGDEYFDANPQLNFRDRDVVAIGPVVASVGSMFDAFWNSELSRDVTEVADSNAGSGDFLRTSAIVIEGATVALKNLGFSLPTGTAAGLVELQASFGQMIWAPARLIYDPPPQADAVDETSESQPSAVALAELAQNTRQEIVFESAYLVLDDDTLAAVHAMREAGIRIRGLTNSLASNDVTANHAAYAKKRRRILASGIDLYELRPDAASCPATVANPAACGPGHIFGLHSKTFVFDRKTVYVGSLNLNLRSRYLNSESGLIIDSTELASSIADAIEQNMQPVNSWHLVLDADGDPLWITENADGAASESRSDPETSWLRRQKAGFIALFPLEKYL